MPSISMFFFCLLFFFLRWEQSSCSHVQGDEVSNSSNSRQIRNLLDSCPGPSAYDLCPIQRQEAAITYSIKPNKKLFSEVSYMVYSQQKYGRDDHPVMWVGSDRGQDSLAAVDLETGETIREYKLDVDEKSDTDWESLSLGPCTEKRRKTCLFVADTGNNDAHDCRDRDCEDGRDVVNVFKFEEPNLSKDDDDDEIKVATIRLNYHDDGFPTNRADCEAVFVDFTGDKAGGKPGDLYLITKMPSTGLQRVGKVPVSVHRKLKAGEKSDTFSIQPVGKPQHTKKWTGVDMNLSGDLIALRHLGGVFFFPRPQSLSVGDVMSRSPCPFKSETDIEGSFEQYEAVTWIGDNIAEASECKSRKACTVIVTVHKLQYPFISDTLFGGNMREKYVYEAEAASLAGASISTKHPGFFGNGFVDFSKEVGEYVEWNNVEASTTGLYRLLFRYALNAPDGRGCKVYTRRDNSAFDVPFPDTGSWQAWRFRVIENIPFCKGLNTVRVQTTGMDGPNLDMMIVQKM